MNPLSRRDFVKTTAAAITAASVTGAVRVLGETLDATAVATPREVELHWLEGGSPALSTGGAWGVPWPRGAVKRGQEFALRTDKGEALPVQSWELAYWPDDSLKWTGHAIGADSGLTEKLVLSPGAPAAPVQAVSVKESADAIEIDTGVLQVRIAKRGGMIFDSITRGGREILRAGQLVALWQDKPELEAAGALRQENFSGKISEAAVEQRGPVRAVVKLTGTHKSASGGREWLPFTVRLYFHAGGEAVRMIHSFVYDGDEGKDFIHGLGVRFTVPMRDPLYDRHVRFCGEDKGLWAESVRNLTGLRRSPGRAVVEAQLNGKACPPVEQFPQAISSRLQYIPAWGDCTLTQLSPDSFEIRKRTKPGHGWISAEHGGRAAGVGYIGGATGGAAFGLGDFWQRFPTQLDIRNSASDATQVTLWMWSPDAPAMDLRFYHDGLGMDTHDKQLNGGLEITYEDYEPGFGTPHGIARSSELTLWALDATPAREELVKIGDAVRVPPRIICQPSYIHSTEVFGGAIWNLPDRSTPAKIQLEELLDDSVAYYQKQIDERRWYGFWNYGDVRHTYDVDRHGWRYDVGGFAWDNSELSSDMWLWYTFLRSGRADIFRMAEAMTRHTAEVDVYHAGRFAGLGTRHGVQHWGDSAKQLRISTSIYRRPYYYLSADERMGDILREVVNADAKLAEINPERKLPGQPEVPTAARISVGTDWGSAASNWLTEWERTNDPQPRMWLENAMKVIGGNPLGFFAGGFGYEPASKRLVPQTNPKISVSHLSAVFGLVEVCAELIQLIDVPEFEQAWLKYCTLYNAGAEAQTAALGQPLKDTTLNSAHSRLTAYAAWRTKDSKLAARAWGEFVKSDAAAHGNRVPEHPLALGKPVRVEGPAVLNPVDEIATVSTNETAQRGLSIIENLALIGDYLPARE